MIYAALPTDLLTIKEVEKTTGIKKSNIYLQISQGVFPKQVKLGSRTSRWVRSEVEAWKQEWIKRRVE
ncbi:AlpA family transcriptional regulator [Salmonella enterica]|uniref:helix-turn-helix transcriptional regulator n=1 Tax=Kluyvera georgiana TaxID=73098 RepID=UPI0012C44AA4|nr:AlpA family transcriptional regulator [Salmonella enterica]EAW3345756.1 AlpA family transcriptional regulator [Salmonella enterica]EBD6954659.1 AlpA family transcriptional regulator [Salmonella enterica]ECK6591657.1 AlpA family transcriptional regulator [Salmonella enterica]ECR7631890.1 AlpA family transcriptional regulator [Salmonella enterica]